MNGDLQPYYNVSIYVPMGTRDRRSGRQWPVSEVLVAMRFVEVPGQAVSSYYEDWEGLCKFHELDVVRVNLSKRIKNGPVHKFLCDRQHSHQAGERRGKGQSGRGSRPCYDETVLQPSWALGVYTPGGWFETQASDHGQRSN